MKRFAAFIFFGIALTVLSGCATTSGGGSADSERRVRFTDTPDGAKATFDDSILFAVNSSVLYKQTDELFDAMKPALQRSKGKIIVEGHTDSTGTLANNMKLSQQRAEAVKVALVARQIAPSRIEAKGFGPTKPVVPNAKRPEDLAKNRRAVINFVGETVDSIGGNDIEQAISNVANKISGWVGSLFK